MIPGLEDQSIQQVDRLNTDQNVAWIETFIKHAIRYVKHLSTTQLNTCMAM